MVHRDARGGTLILDRKLRGVGRIKLASGTTNAVLFRRINAMLTHLADEGRLDLLRALRDRLYTPAELHDAYQRRALHTLATPATAKPLVTTMRIWAESYDCSEKHRESLLTSLGYLEGVGPNAIVQDIARLVEQLRGTLGREHPRSFNLLRSAAQAFVRSTLKRSHPLWIEIAAIETVKAKPQRRHHPLSVVEARAFFPQPKTDDVDAIAWGMMVSGMGASEYWGRWAARSDRVHIDGTKRAGRVRDIPLIQRPAVARLHRRTFADKLRERTKRAITPYDLRRTYAHWLELAGVPRSRRKLYLGHAVGNVTGLYELHEVAEFLASDALKLREFLGASHENAHELRVAK